MFGVHRASLSTGTMDQLCSGQLARAQSADYGQCRACCIRNDLKNIFRRAVTVANINTLGPAWKSAVSDANDEKVLYPSWLHESGVRRRRHTASELCPLSLEWVGRCTGRVTMRRPQQIRVNRGVVCSILERTQYRPEEDAKISKSLTRTNQVSHCCLDKSLLHVPHS